MAALKLKAFGTSTGLVLPEEMLVRLPVETAEGYLLSPFDPEIAQQVRFGREGMIEFREIFKRLAE